MTATVAGTAAVPALADPGERGRTTVADRVIAKIAAAAATEVDGAAGLQRSLAGRDLGRPEVRADADVDGAVATLRLQIAVDYPAPVQQVSRAVRRRVVDTLADLAGVRVDHVDITVAALRRPPVTRRRVL